MADDSSYAAFLNKANADLSSSSSHQQPPHATTTTTATATSTIPAPLKPIVQCDSHTYTSDTDSQWEPVSIPYHGSSALPLSAEEFKKAISTSAKVEELPVSDFDPHQQYGGVIHAVEEAAAAVATATATATATAATGDVKIFRVQVDRTRVEYYIVSVSNGHTAERKLVGVVARAVES